MSKGQKVKWLKKHYRMEKIDIAAGCPPPSVCCLLKNVSETGAFHIGSGILIDC
jgi:hypothetical protein